MNPCQPGLPDSARQSGGRPCVPRRWPHAKDTPDELDDTDFR